MAYSEAQKRASRKYNETNYDRINLTVPKGQREAIREKAKSLDMSLNEYIYNLIKKSM